MQEWMNDTMPIHNCSSKSNRSAPCVHALLLQLVICLHTSCQGSLGTTKKTQEGDPTLKQSFHLHYVTVLSRALSLFLSRVRLAASWVCYNYLYVCACAGWTSILYGTAPDRHATGLTSEREGESSAIDRVRCICCCRTGRKAVLSCRKRAAGLPEG